MIDLVSLRAIQQTGLNERQARVYLALLTLGTGTAAEVANVAELKRSSVYELLDDLGIQGLVEIQSTEPVKMYAPVDPIKQAQRLDRGARQFREMLPYLQSLRHKSEQPIVTYLRGTKGLREAFLEIERPKDVCYLTSISKLNKFLPEEVARWLQRYQAGQARSGGRHVLTDSKDDRDFGAVITRSGQVVRYLPKGYQLDMDLAIFDNRVVLAAFDSNPQATVIDSPALYRSFQSLFELTWKCAHS